MSTRAQAQAAAALGNVPQDQPPEIVIPENGDANRTDVVADVDIPPPSQAQQIQELRDKLRVELRDELRVELRDEIEKIVTASLHRGKPDILELPVGERTKEYYVHLRNTTWKEIHRTLWPKIRDPETDISAWQISFANYAVMSGLGESMTYDDEQLDAMDQEEMKIRQTALFTVIRKSAENLLIGKDLNSFNKDPRCAALAWRAIDRRFNVKTLSYMWKMKDDFYQAPPPLDLTGMENFIAECTQRRDKLKAIDADIQDVDFIRHIIRAIPGSDQTNFYELLPKADKPSQINLVECINTIIQYCRNHTIFKNRPQETTTSPLEAQLAMREDRRCYNCDERGHLKGDCPKDLKNKFVGSRKPKYPARTDRGNSGHSDKRGNSGQSDKCGNCGLRNHRTKDCRRPKQDKSGKRERKESLAFVVEIFVGTSATEDVSNEWLLDSGAAAHMSPYRSDFYETELEPTTKTIRVASGQVIKATGQGTIRARVRTANGDIDPVEFKNALYIPELGRRLISSTAITSKGFAVWARYDAGTIKSRDITIKIKLKPNIGFMIPIESVDEQQSEPPTRKIKTSGANAAEQAGSGTPIHPDIFYSDFDDEPPISQSTEMDDDLPTTKSNDQVENPSVRMDASSRSGVSSVGNKFMELNYITELWHSRTGHVNKQTLYLMSVGDRVEGMDKLKSSAREHVEGSCKPCALGKSQRKPVPKVTEKPRTTDRGEFIHMDIYGPMPQASRQGSRYMLIIVDDYSRMKFVYFIKTKSAVTDCLRTFIGGEIEPLDLRVKYVRLDGPKEFCESIEFSDFCTSKGIQRQFSAPYTPQQNGVAERAWRVITEKGQTMRIGAGLPSGHWEDANATACYLTNRTINKHNTSQTPFELWYQRKPNLSNLRIFGCVAIVHDEHRQNKLEAKSWEGKFIGYHDRSKTYLIMGTNGKVIRTRNAEFREQTFLREQFGYLTESPVSVPKANQTGQPLTQSSSSSSSPSTIIRQHTTGDEKDKSHVTHPGHVIENTTSSTKIQWPSIREKEATTQRDEVATSPAEESQPSIQGEDPEDQSEEHGQFDSMSMYMKHGLENTLNEGGYWNTDGSSASTRPKRSCPSTYSKPAVSDPEYPVYHALACMEVGPTSLLHNAPTTYKKAMASPMAHHWKEAMTKEYETLKDMRVFKIVERKPNQRDRDILSGRWVFAHKTDSFGNIIRYKARFVAKGFQQVHGRDYDETWAPVCRPTTMRFLLMIGTFNKWDIKQSDITNAFLYATLNEDTQPTDEPIIIYMRQPEGFEIGGPEMICETTGNLYGTRQGARNFYLKLSKTLSKMGLVMAKADPCLFTFNKDGNVLFVTIYVDDITYTGTLNIMMKFREHMNNNFKCSHEEISWILGIKINRDVEKRTIQMTHDVYIKGVLERFHMDNANISPIPAVPDVRLSLDDCPKTDRERSLMKGNEYRQIIGSLSYAAHHSRPDIAIAVAKLAQFCQDPGPKHLQAAKTVMRYLRGTPHRGLKFNFDNDTTMTLTGFVDSDFGNDKDDRKSYTGYAFFINNAILSWSATKQKLVTTSSTEAEYVALYHAASEAINLRKLAEDFGFVLSGPTVIYTDSQCGEALAKNDVYHDRTKHIDVKYHKTREYVRHRQIDVKHIPGKDNMTDALTKPLARVLFERHMSRLMGEEEIPPGYIPRGGK